jgi:peptidoglycan lytic transglycosylase
MTRRHALLGLALAGLAFGLVGCATARPSPPAAPQSSTTAHPDAGKRIAGLASWYGQQHHGRRTASGELYDMNKLTAAHRTFPFGTRLRVTNVENGRNVVVRVNDRGPHVDGRILDLSQQAATTLGMIEAGVARVEAVVLTARD